MESREVGAALERIERRVAQIDSIDRRLESLESEVRALVTPPRLLTLEEVAKYMACHPKTVRRMIDDGRLRVVLIGKGDPRIPLGDFIRFATIPTDLPASSPTFRPKSAPNGRTEAEAHRAALRKKRT